MGLLVWKSAVAASLLGTVIAQNGTKSGYDWVDTLIGTTNGGL
jgi:hypothetical protein